jgi:hypothetical protein
MKKTNKIILIFAVISTLYVIVAFYIGIRSNWLSPLIFSDHDEPLYIPMTKLVSDREFKTLFTEKYIGKNSFQFPPVPYLLTDFIIGKLTNISKNNPFIISLCFDLICSFLSLIVLFFTYKKLSTSTDNAFSASLVTVFMPWLISPIENMGSFLSDLFPRIASYSHFYFESLPTHRWLHTQLSVLLFYCFIYLLTAAYYNKRSYLTLVACAAVGAFQVYVYFFGWLSCITILSMFLLFLVISKYQTKSLMNIPLEILKPASLLLLFLIISTPGIRIIYNGIDQMYNVNNLNIPESSTIPVINYRDFMFFSPTLFLLLLVVIYFIQYSKSYPKINILVLSYLVIFIFSEFILMNLHLIIGKWIFPYHFTVFYIHPILGGLFTIFILDFLSLKLKIKKIIQNLILVYLTASRVINATQLLQTFNNSEVLLDLMKYIKVQTPPNSVIAVYPYGLTFEPEQSRSTEVLPYWIYALTDRNFIYDFTLFSSNKEEVVKYELFHNWLFTDKNNLLISCPTEFLSPSAQDLFTGPGYFTERRKAECLYYLSKPDLFNKCEMLKVNQVDFILRHHDKELAIPFWYQEYTKVVWSNTNSNVSLLKFDRDRYLLNNCAAD